MNRERKDSFVQNKRERKITRETKGRGGKGNKETVYSVFS
jgi:hypothetical protein